MRRIYGQIGLLIIFMLAASVTTWAQKPLKGNWTFNIPTGTGTTTLPIPYTFKASGKGIIPAPTGKINFAYREKGAGFSLIFEAPGAGPGGIDVTVLLRGTKTDTTVTGSTIVVTDMPDPSNPLGFAVFAGPLTGARN